MKKLLFILAFFGCFSAQAQFPSIDSLLKFTDRYIRNSAVEAFTNLRLNTVIHGLADFMGAGAPIDSVYAVNDSTLRIKAGATTFEAVIRGVYDYRRKVDSMYVINDSTLGFTINNQARTITIKGSTITASGGVIKVGNDLRLGGTLPGTATIDGLNTGSLSLNNMNVFGLTNVSNLIASTNGFLLDANRTIGGQETISRISALDIASPNNMDFLTVRTDGVNPSILGLVFGPPENTRSIMMYASGGDSAGMVITNVDTPRLETNVLLRAKGGMEIYAPDASSSVDSIAGWNPVTKRFTSIDRSLFAPANTASNGITKEGNDFKFGGPSGSASAATLQNNREVPMNGKDIYLSGSGRLLVDSGRIVIGTEVDPLYPLSVKKVYEGVTQANYASTVAKYPFFTDKHVQIVDDSISMDGVAGDNAGLFALRYRGKSAVNMRNTVNRFTANHSVLFLEKYPGFLDTTIFYGRDLITPNETCVPSGFSAILSMSQGGLASTRPNLARGWFAAMSAEVQMGGSAFNKMQHAIWMHTGGIGNAAANAIENGYALYISPFGTGVTNKYAIYQQGTLDTSYLAGKIRFAGLAGTGTRIPTLSPTGVVGALANGTNGQVLTLVGGSPAWASAGGGGLTGAGNGLSVSGGIAMLGQAVGDPLNPAALTADREIPADGDYSLIVKQSTAATASSAIGPGRLNITGDDVNSAPAIINFADNNTGFYNAHIAFNSGGTLNLGVNGTDHIVVNDVGDIALGAYPNSRNDGTTSKALYVDVAGKIQYGTISGSGISSLNSLTGATQTFATGTSGTDFGISSSGTVHTFNLPDAGPTSRGVITTGTQTIAGGKTFPTAATFTNGFTVGSGAGMVWSGRSRLSSGADGTITMQNNAANGFTGLTFGPATSSHVGIFKSGTTLQVRLGDNSADASLTTGELTPRGNVWTKIRTITTSTVLDKTDHTVLVDASSGNVTVTLPTAASCYNGGYSITITIKRIDNSGNTLTVAVSGSDTIDGSGTGPDMAPISTYSFKSAGGTAWYWLNH